MGNFKIHKSPNYITIGNYHFKEKDMSLKAIGLLSIMLSLPENWDYSVKGLAKIRKESVNTINSILKELEHFGYLERTRIRDEKGKFLSWEYNIYEYPYLKKRDMEKRDTVFCVQYNNMNNNNILTINNNNKRKYKKKVEIDKKIIDYDWINEK